MPKIFPNEEKLRVKELSQLGHPNTKVAAMMKEEFPGNWSSSSGNRAVARILKEPDPEEEPEKTLDEMSRDERFKHISARLQGTMRFKTTFRNFDEDEKNLFIEEYLNVIKSTDTLTEVEEQAVFAAILELILAFQALNRKEREERWRDLSMDAEMPEDDPRFRRVVDDKYQKEYDQHMKLYQKGMSELKMSRSQRLKEIRSQKQTLVDLAEQLSHKDAQAEIANEIERLAKLKDDELKKLLDEKIIHGVFEGY